MLSTHISNDELDIPTRLAMVGVSESFNSYGPEPWVNDTFLVLTLLLLAFPSILLSTSVFCFLFSQISKLQFIWAMNDDVTSCLLELKHSLRGLI